LLVQEVVAKYPGQVVFSNENLGESKLAEQFGVKGYPAVFMDGVLVAVPRDFGYFGGSEKTSRYAPWSDARNREKFKQDMTRMIDLILSGKRGEVVSEQGAVGSEQEIESLPAFALTDLSGNPLTSTQAAGRVVVVEFWATWCVPCRSTLGWLGELQRRYGDSIAVLALAVESPEAEVRKAVAGQSQELRWAIITPEVARAFGDVVAVPTLFAFDREGKKIGVWYGAPPELHDQAGKVIESLVNHQPGAAGR
jgi:thiol-disulfide isomerase/thioredoxin